MEDSPVVAWQPRYTLTPAVARHLMEIEGARAVVEQVHLPLAVQSEMRNRARIRATHYSTRIEGHRLTLAEAEQVVGGGARDRVDRGTDPAHPCSGEGKTRPALYRERQNMIRESFRDFRGGAGAANVLLSFGLEPQS
jgi:hypothetical protein